MPSPLAELVARLERRSAKRLSRAELRDLPARYRALIGELAEARAQGASPTALANLEGLAVRAHGLLYAPQPTRLGPALGRLLRIFPSTVRQRVTLVGVAFALFLLGALWGYVEVRRDPASAVALLPGSWQENAEAFQQATRHGGNPLLGSFYFTNNAQVALMCYALGATFGLGTVLMLLFNGVIFGATVAVVNSLGALPNLLAFVLPHASVELGAIFIAAAGGLVIGDSLLRPGWLRRRDAFKHAARNSLPLVLGSALLLLVAGLVEGWISPMPLPFAVKAAIGGTLTALLLLYLFFGNRHQRVVDSLGGKTP